MIFALLTLLSALSIALVAGWFSIVGFMTIYAGQPFYALIMGAVTEIAKLVTTSWLYRNWQYAGWKLKLPLLYFTLALMTATSIGVFGFLSKAHLEQGSATVDNSAKIDQLNYQIEREKSVVADNEKIIIQLDSAVNSLLEKDLIDRSLSVRKSQASQRKQLRDSISESQKVIDQLNNEKFKLESEVRKMQLEVGPIRYIAELFYGVEENSSKNIESAVKMFTLLLVSTLDPLAVILLIAANHTLMRLKNKGTEYVSTTDDYETNSNEGADKPPADPIYENSEQINEFVADNHEIIEPSIQQEIHGEIPENINEEEKTTPEGAQDKSSDEIGKFPVSVDAVEKSTIEKNIIDLPSIEHIKILPVIKTPLPTPVIKTEETIETIETEKTYVDINSSNHLIIKESADSHHFIPKKIEQLEKNISDVNSQNTNVVQDTQKSISKLIKAFPQSLSWLSEFRGQKNGQQ